MQCETVCAIVEISFIFLKSKLIHEHRDLLMSLCSKDIISTANCTDCIENEDAEVFEARKVECAYVSFW